MQTRTTGSLLTLTSTGGRSRASRTIMKSTAGIVDAEAEVAEAEADVCCANCGIAGVDDVQLEDCNGCDLVKYCSDKCREEHREMHVKECNKSDNQLHDKELFSQPDGSYLGECPICFLPLPLDRRKSVVILCCSKIICLYDNVMVNKQLARRCPFCREPGTDGVEYRKRRTERIEANDPVALSQMGMDLCDGDDCNSAFEYLTKASELGDSEAHFLLGMMYYEGEGVEKDDEKSNYHWEKAAIGGHPIARYNLAGIDEENGNIERSVKHHIIAANLGYEESMKALWRNYSARNITKEDLEAALRTHKTAIDATISPRRKVAEAFFRGLRHK